MTTILGLQNFDNLLQLHQIQMKITIKMFSLHRLRGYTIVEMTINHKSQRHDGERQDINDLNNKFVIK